jgi:hypothetical protein
MANPTSEWTKVLIHPLGLTGYVLFLLFGLVARAKRRDERRWILPVTLIAAGIVLVGGLGLAYREVDRQAHEPVTVLPAPTPTLQQQSNEQIQQRSTGDNSPNVQGTQGDVNLTYGAGQPAKEQNRQQHKKPEQKKTHGVQAQ